MAKGTYILKIGADISAVRAAVAAAKGEIRTVGENEVLIQLDYDHGNLADLQAAVQAIADSNPEVRVQVNYDLQSATLRQKLEEQAADTNLYDLLTAEKSGKKALSDYIGNICAEVADGLDEGLSKTKLAEKLKKALDLSASYTNVTDGKYIEDSVLGWVDELQENFKSLENYDPIDNIFSGLRDKIERNETIIHGLELQLEDLKKAGAIDTTEVIDFSGAEKATDALDEVSRAVDKVEEKAADGKIKFFDGVSEQIYDVIEDAEKIEELFDRLASKWSNVGFRTGTGFTNEKGRVTDNLYSQLVGGMDGDTFGSGTYFGGDFAGTLRWMESSGYDRSLFAANLEPLTRMLRLESDDMAYELERAMQEIHAFIAEDIFPHENYETLLNDVVDFDTLFESNRELFEALKISKQQVEEFVTQQKDWLSQFKTSDGSIPEVLKHEESFGSKFVKYALGVNGIDASLLSGNIDSSTLGTNVFDKALAESLERLDFGNNKEIAQKFAEKVIGNILKRKAENPDVDLDETFKIYTGVKSKAFSSGNFAEMAKGSVFSEDSIKYLYSQLEDARNIQSKATSLSFQDLNDDWFNSSKIDDYISKLERLYQLQKTIADMKPESAYSKSYEEIGKHIEKLNAQYEQTVAEIERLREADDGSQEIKEQIGLLENLAVAYQNAIYTSIPNDVSPGSWISRYTNIPREELFGESRKFKYDKIKQGADEFRNGLEQEILDIYRIPHPDDSFLNLSDEKINTSALSEIPEIMDRITSAGKEATQTMEQFGNAVSGEGSGIGDTSNEEVDALREELEEAHRRNRNQADIIESIQDDKYREEERADQAERDLERAEQSLQELESQLQSSSTSSAAQSDTDQTRENTEETERNTEATEENTEAHKENQEVKQESSTSGAQEADTDSMRENTAETEKNTEAQKENREAKEGSAQTGHQESQTEATREDTAETEKNTQAHKENREAKESTGQAEQTSSSTQQTKEDTEETEKNTQAHRENREEKERATGETGSQNFNEGEAAQRSTSDIQQEVEALNSLGATAITAAMNKDKVAEANIRLASQIIGSSIPAINKEAAALNDLASAADEAASAKKDYTKASSSKESGQTKSGGSGGKKTDPAKEAEQKATADAEDLVKRINTLRSRQGDYLKNLQFISVNGLAGKSSNPVTKSVGNYEAEVRNVATAVDDLKAKWKDQNNAVNDADRAVKQFLSDMSVSVSRDDIIKQAKQQIDTIDRAMSKRDQQGSGFTEDYKKRLLEARQAAEEVAEAARSLNLDKSFDTSGVQEWIKTLDKGRTTLKEINDQQHLLATGTQLNKLLGKINGDIEKGGLKGELSEKYEKLKQDVLDAVSAIEKCTTAEEAASKVNFSKLNASYESLKASAKEAGQLQDGFNKKFADAINNQSAQFLATYFSFQDIIRYSKQIAQTVIGTDSALIELKKVSDASNDRIQQSFQKSAETAQELGSTITEVINSTSDWARLNYRSVIW